ncbi:MULTISPECIES: AraC family transcriptional regulator [unclassified Mycobacterium]|uniref:helix-turn-helix transcriptional regulator n=1 Tax=unclassified Mycobacterium TaxID=2642494 RepID=UPI0007FBF35C|nr:MULTISPECIES: AraC family transcriptional regulator [unclassified Mycobacterium]OBG60260.1 AraC family transcriptional regulator [Mycobacterium sp. E188]OBG66398.1 AraC family transcriptional regulator [Mycobacterium sp. E735]OBG95213.1 AraC family transcriptional regulator [Mycobacterium sp. E3298]OBH42807.1 AraC family transcriptional regulator [Mycobacterium sp. E183]
MTQPARMIRHRRGVPIYEYRTGPDTPPVSVLRAGREDLPEQRRHIHEFPALWYTPDSGVVYVLAAGAVIDPAQVVGLIDVGVGVFFDPAALGEAGRSPWPAWRAHPLLFPFLHGRSGGLLRLEVPADRRSAWEGAIASIETELNTRREGYQQASLAHLTLLLIDLSRLAVDVVGDLRRSGEPLLAEVFEVIDRRLAEPLSLRDVAGELGITAGHLTTVVRRRTGRTVQEWIIERRMAEARTLLAETDLPIAEVAGRVGIGDPGYFSRLFGRTHGVAPRVWRGSNR